MHGFLSITARPRPLPGSAKIGDRRAAQGRAAPEPGELNRQCVARGRYACEPRVESVGTPRPRNLVTPHRSVRLPTDGLR